MRRIIIAGLLILSGAINASAETDIFKDVRTPHGHARSQAAKMADVGACGARNAEVSRAKYPAVVKCMNSRGWRIAYIKRDPPPTARRTNTAPSAPADPYFSTNVKVQPGHFIDHDTGLDCVHMGWGDVCDPPKGTVNYFDPDQNLPCKRTGAFAICSNL